MATEKELASAANCASVNLPADDEFVLRVIVKNTSASDAAANYVLNHSIEGLNTRTTIAAAFALVRVRREAQSRNRKATVGWTRTWSAELDCWTSAWG